MIFTVTGKIGGGKTYWCVNYMVEKYLVYKESVFQYVPRTDLHIVTNIRDLYLPHTDLDTEIKKLGISGVFNPEYVKGHFNTVFIIDEAQILFHRRFNDVSVFAFFQTSRHYGVDVILITQDTDSLCKEIKVLSEYEIEATSRSQRTKNVFIYKYKSGDEIAKRQILKFNKKIASLYRSQFKDENEKAPMIWKRYALIAAIMVIAVIFGFRGLMTMWKPKDVQAKPKAVLMTDKEVADLGLVAKNDTVEIESHEKSVPDPEQFQEEDTGRIVIIEQGRVTGVVTNEDQESYTSNRSCSLAKLVCVGVISPKLLDYCTNCSLGIEQERAKPRLAAENERSNLGLQDSNKIPTPQKSVGVGMKVFDSLKGAE